MHYLGTVIKVHVEDLDLDFVNAKDIAKQEAKKQCAVPMLLSWYQGKTGEGYPNLECGKADAPLLGAFMRSHGMAI